MLSEFARHRRDSGVRHARRKNPRENEGFGALHALLACALLALCPFAHATTALIADRLIDGSSNAPRRDAAVLVDGDRIVAVGDRSIVPEDAEVIDLGDATLMPGMINAHEHPLMFTSDYQAAHLEHSSAYKALVGLAGLQRLLLAGWTGVRVMGDADVYYATQDLRRIIEAGVFIGPHMTGAAHYISITGGGGDVNYLSPEQQVIADGLVVDGPDEIRKAVRTEIKYGSDWIKLLVTGAFESVGDNPKNVAFAPDELRAAVEEANRHGVPVAAHAHAAAGIKQAVAAGVRSIEHGTYMDDEAIRMMVEHGTYLVPTVYLGDYYAEPDNTLRAQDKNDDYTTHYRATFLEMIRKAHRAGVKVVVGLDLGSYGVDPEVYAREFAVFVEAGISPMDAIKAGTSVAADLMGWDDVGTIAKGKQADIIAVPGNPLDDISDLEHVSMVMMGGRVLKRPGEESPLSELLPGGKLP